MKLPTFLIIGAQKSATRWLRTTLGRHREIFTADREQEFFNHHWALGPRWYAHQFERAGGKEIVGEATPGYMMLNEDPGLQAARIDGLLPDVRLVAVLRNPVDRTYSAFIHFMREGRVPPDAELVDRVRQYPDPLDDPECLVGGSLYFASLEPYIERFGERLLVVRQDDIKTDAVALYQRVLRHLGADPGYLPERGLDRVMYSNPTPTESKYSSGEGRRELAPDERAELFTLFEKDLLQLEDATGVDTSIWRPA